MSDKPKSGNKIKNCMVRVLCAGQVVWANACKAGFRCTKCGQEGHTKA